MKLSYVYLLYNYINIIISSHDSDQLIFSMRRVGNKIDDGYMKSPIISDKLQLPRAMYHFSNNEMTVGSKFKIPTQGDLLNARSLLKNNRQQINGLFVPLPNANQINLHFINEQKNENVFDTDNDDDSMQTALQRAKRICANNNSFECEESLLHYHRIKSRVVRFSKLPLHLQLMELGKVSSNSKLSDKKTNSMGVVVDVAGYEPIYVGGQLGHDNEKELKINFEPPLI